jgi:MerR family redox-sensitive transcriptional activator SoxR
MLSIGQVASRTGLRASAIRYYEAQGLLPTPSRTGGKRVYDGSIVERIALIELAKMAGFNLNEIRATLSDADARKPATRWKTLTEAKRLEVDAEMKRLMDAKYVLTRMSACSCATLEECARAFLDGMSKQPLAAPMNLTTRRKHSAKRLKRRT